MPIILRSDSNHEVVHHTHSIACTDDQSLMVNIPCQCADGKTPPAVPSHVLKIFRETGAKIPLDTSRVEGKAFHDSFTEEDRKVINSWFVAIELEQRKIPTPIPPVVQPVQPVKQPPLTRKEGLALDILGPLFNTCHMELHTLQVVVDRLPLIKKIKGSEVSELSDNEIKKIQERVLGPNFAEIKDNLTAIYKMIVGEMHDEIICRRSDFKFNKTIENYIREKGGEAVLDTIVENYLIHKKEILARIDLLIGYCVSNLDALTKDLDKVTSAQEVIQRCTGRQTQRALTLAGQYLSSRSWMPLMELIKEYSIRVANGGGHEEAALRGSVEKVKGKLMVTVTHKIEGVPELTVRELTIMERNMMLDNQVEAIKGKTTKFNESKRQREEAPLKRIIDQMQSTSNLDKLKRLGKEYQAISGCLG